MWLPEKVTAEIEYEQLSKSLMKWVQVSFLQSHPYWYIADVSPVVSVAIISLNTKLITDFSEEIYTQGQGRTTFFEEVSQSFSGLVCNLQMKINRGSAFCFYTSK